MGNQTLHALKVSVKSLFSAFQVLWSKSGGGNLQVAHKMKGTVVPFQCHKLYGEQR
jgi:hypothetical protein